MSRESRIRPHSRMNCDEGEVQRHLRLRTAPLRSCYDAAGNHHGARVLRGCGGCEQEGEGVDGRGTGHSLRGEASTWSRSGEFPPTVQRQGLRVPSPEAWGLCRVRGHARRKGHGHPGSRDRPGVFSLGVADGGLHAVRLSRLRLGDTVVLRDAGPIGLFAMQSPFLAPLLAAASLGLRVGGEPGKIAAGRGSWRPQGVQPGTDRCGEGNRELDGSRCECCLRVCRGKAHPTDGHGTGEDGWAGDAHRPCLGAGALFPGGKSGTGGGTAELLCATKQRVAAFHVALCRKGGCGRRR